MRGSCDNTKSVKKVGGSGKSSSAVELEPRPTSAVHNGGDYNQLGNESGGQQYNYHHSHCRRPSLGCITPVDHYCGGSAPSRLQKANAVL